MTAAREWQLDGHAGRLAGRTWEGAEPTHVVLLAHGYGEHTGRYDHVAAALVAAGASVHAVDHVGHGKSEGDRVVVTDFELVVDDLNAVDEQARAQQQDLPVVLIGHSMGGLIAARYAQRYGASLAGVVLSGPLVGHWGGARLLELDEMPDAPLDSTTLSRDPEVGRAYEADPLVWHGPFRRVTVEAIARALEAVQAGPSLGSLPLMWAHGTDDQLVPADGARSGIEHLRGDTYVERLYPGAQHEIFNETNRDEVLADVVGFVRDVVAR